MLRVCLEDLKPCYCEGPFRKAIFAWIWSSIFRGGLHTLNLQRGWSKKRQHEARKTHKDPLWKSQGIQCYQKKHKCLPCGLSRPVGGGRYCSFQQKWSSPLAALTSCRSQIPRLFIGEAGPQRAQHGPPLAIPTGSVVICRTCTNASSNRNTFNQSPAQYRRVFDTIAAHLPERLGICTWSWAVATAPVVQHNSNTDPRLLVSEKELSLPSTWRTLNVYIYIHIHIQIHIYIYDQKYNHT